MRCHSRISITSFVSNDKHYKSIIIRLKFLSFQLIYYFSLFSCIRMLIPLPIGTCLTTQEKSWCNAIFSFFLALYLFECWPSAYYTDFPVYIDSWRILVKLARLISGDNIYIPYPWWYWYDSDILNICSVWFSDVHNIFLTYTELWVSANHS